MSDRLKEIDCQLKICWGIHIVVSALLAIWVWRLPILHGATINIHSLVIQSVALVVVLLLFVASLVFLHKVIKLHADIRDKDADAERKIRMMYFEYALYQTERSKRLEYERCSALIEKLKAKDTESNSTLREDFDKFKESMETWKTRQDKTLLTVRMGEDITNV
jgi:phosphoglycerol transferase MdoB-like AlkP superfamily enzyme